MFTMDQPALASGAREPNAALTASSRIAAAPSDLAEGFPLAAAQQVGVQMWQRQQFLVIPIIQYAKGGNGGHFRSSVRCYSRVDFNQRIFMDLCRLRARF